MLDENADVLLHVSLLSLSETQQWIQDCLCVSLFDCSSVTLAQKTSRKQP